MNLENQEWNTFLNTRKNGDYSVARNGWVADFNDPICFLDMWISSSGNNDVQFGKGDHAAVKAYSLDLTPYGLDTKVENGTWAETYDFRHQVLHRQGQPLCHDAHCRGYADGHRLHRASVLLHRHLYAG